MSACSSPELEAGPLRELDAADFVGPPEPPVFTPLAEEFASHNAGWLSTLDTSIAILDAESAIDIGGDILSGLGALASVKSAAVDPEALANLQAAEDGYRVARAQTAALKANVPSDVQQPTAFLSFNFVVQDAAGARLPGALVTIDTDFGNGTTRSTDGRGIANFGVALTGVLGYTVAKAGYQTASGVLTLGSTLAQLVALEPA